MAYLGNTPTTQSFIAGTDVFNGTGAQVAYTLSRSINSPNDIQIVVNNVVQDPTTYTTSGTLLTFSAAPSSGTGNIYVRYLSTTLQSVGVGDLSVSTNKIQDNAITTAKIAAGAVIPADLSTGAPAWTAAGLFQFNSGYGSVATAYGCRAWVNFNGTGTVAIRASGNVSSVTDNGVGNYTINFATAMPDINYSFTACGTYAAANGSDAVAGGSSFNSLQSNPPTTTKLQGYWKQGNTSSTSDSSLICVAVFR